MTDFNPEEHLGRLIVRATALLSQSLHQALDARGFDITAEQFAVLIILWEEDGYSQTELAKRAFKDNPTVSRMLKLLRNKELVLRKRDDEDQRATQVYLTQEGRELVNELIPPALEVLQKAQTGLSDQEAKELKRMLRIVIENLQ